MICLRSDSARYRPTGGPVLDVPDWFPDWFDEHVPHPEGTGFRPLDLADVLGLGKDVVYRALHDGRLEGMRVSNKGWLVPREAVRLWLVEANTLNLS